MKQRSNRIQVILTLVTGVLFILTFGCDRGKGNFLEQFVWEQGILLSPPLKNVAICYQNKEWTPFVEETEYWRMKAGAFCLQSCRAEPTVFNFIHNTPSEWSGNTRV